MLLCTATMKDRPLSTFGLLEAISDHIVETGREGTRSIVIIPA